MVPHIKRLLDEFSCDLLKKINEDMDTISDLCGLGMFPDKIIGNQILKRICHLQIITEHLIKADLEILDPRLLPLVCFKFRKPFLPVRFGGPQPVYFFVWTRWRN